MPEVLGDPPSPRTALFWNGTAWQWALVDAAGHLQVDVVASGLPAGAATAAAQALALAQLQLIEDMRDALQSVGTDRLIVRGEDQLHSYGGPLVSARTAVISGADGWVDSETPGAGVVWAVTNVAVQDQTSPITAFRLLVRRAAANYTFHQETIALAVTDYGTHSCQIWLEQNDTIRAYYTGALAGDTCRVFLTGHYMALET